MVRVYFLLRSSEKPPTHTRVRVANSNAESHESYEGTRMDDNRESRSLRLSLSHCHRYRPFFVFARKTDIHNNTRLRGNSANALMKL